LQELEIFLGPMADGMGDHHDVLSVRIQKRAGVGAIKEELEFALAVMGAVGMRVQEDAIPLDPANAWDKDHSEGEVFGFVRWKYDGEFHGV
jgi:hypothetical protein